MKLKSKQLEKITAGILVVGATFFGLLTLSITPPPPQSDLINNSNLTTYKSNKANNAAINTLKSKIKGKGEIIQTSMSNRTSSALVQGSDNKDHLYMWGDNSLNQQGDGGKHKEVETPTEVEFKGVTVTNITQISMSDWTSSALVLDDRGKTHLYMWGYNYHHEQGDGKPKYVKKPTEVKFFDTLTNKGETITQISMSEYTSSALVQDLYGKTHLYMWGANNYGQQGVKKGGNVKTPTEVKFNNNVKNITQISMLGLTSSALVQGFDNKTHLYMWGRNDEGQQGNGQTNDITTPTDVEFFNKLKKEITITQISMSNHTSSALVQYSDKTTHLYMWGINDNNQQGDKKPKIVTTPKEVKFDEKVKNITQISMSSDTSSALVQGFDNKTHLYMWGYNAYGQQGDKKSGGCVPTPTEVKLPSNLIITQISMSGLTSSALVKDLSKITQLYMWGRNSDFQQGGGSESFVDTPTDILTFEKELKGVQATHITATQIGADKVSIKFNLEQDKNPSKKEVEVSDLWITYGLDNKTKKLQTKRSWGSHNAIISGLSSGKYLYTIHVKYHAIGIQTWISEQTFSTNSFSIQELKDVQATDIKTTQIGDDEIFIEFNLKQANATSKKDVEVSKSWIETDNSKITEIPNTNWGRNNVKISGLGYGKHSYTIHVKYHAIGIQTWVSEKKLGTNSFLIKEGKDIKATNIKTTQIVLIFLGALLFSVLLSGSTIGFLRKKDAKAFEKYEAKQMSLDSNNYAFSTFKQERTKKEKKTRN